jgi:hypothetical protein
MIASSAVMVARTPAQNGLMYIVVILPVVVGITADFKYSPQ